jgi:hypothetical protein
MKRRIIFPKVDTLFYETDPTDSNFLARKVAEHTLSL